MAVKATLILAAALWSAAAQAQTAVATEDGRGDSANNSVAGASGGVAEPGLVLTADSKGTTASATLATPPVMSRVDADGTAVQQVFSLTLSGEIDKDSGVADFIADSGPLSGASLELSYSLLTGKVGPLKIPVDEQIALLMRLRAACAADARNKEGAAGALDCKGGSFQTLRAYATTEEIATVTRASTFKDSAFYLLGVSGKIGYDKHDYRDAISFAEKSATKVPFALSLRAGVIPPASNAVYLAVGAEYKVDYQAAKKRTLCPAAAGAALVECTTASFAAPERDKDKALFALFRTRRPVALVGPPIQVGIEVKAAYDAVDKVFGVSVPLYLMGDGKGALRGGVRFDWASKGDHFKAAFFVGSAFSLFQ